MTETALERVRRICLALPEAWEQEAWGAPTFRVGKRMFAMYVDNHHGDGRLALWCNAPVGVQEMVVRDAPARYFVPPYMGPRGWIGIILEACTDGELHADLVQAYCVVAPKKLQKLLG